MDGFLTSTDRNDIATVKIGPPSKISPPPFLNEVVAKGAFRSTCSCYVIKHRRSTVQGERLSNEGRHNLLLRYKQVHDNSSIAESLHVG